ncbi:MAG: DUF6544 family protein [Blastocatellia bacterium]
MTRWGKFTLAGLGLVGAGSALSVALGSAAWHRTTSQLIERLQPPNHRGESRTVSFQDLDALPAPVARYFRFALTDGQPLIRRARVHQQGEFRLNDKWIPFTATQHFAATPPGMIWDADMRMNPLLNVRVRDAYVAGQGSMQVKLLALIPVVNEQGGAELKAGALQRYLAEAVWLPTALLPSDHLQWSAIDEQRALATLTDSGLSVSLEFRFNDVGEIISFYTHGRYYREDDGSNVLQPWAGYLRAYEERSGMRIPLEGGVEWQLPSRRLPYCKLRLVNVEYEFAG